MKRKKPSTKPQIERIKQNKRTLGELILKSWKKIERMPNWKNIRAGEDYDVDSLFRLDRFLKKLTEEENSLRGKKEKGNAQKALNKGELL